MWELRKGDWVKLAPSIHENLMRIMGWAAEIDSKPKLLPPLRLKPLLPKKEINYEVNKRVYGTHTR